MAPYLLGVVTAPLLAKVVKPTLRAAVKASVGVAMEVKKAAGQVVEEFQDIAAEATFEKVAAAADVKHPGGVPKEPFAKAVVDKAAKTAKTVNR